MENLKSKSTAELWRRREIIIVKRIWTDSSREWHKLSDLTDAIAKELDRRRALAK